MSASAIRTQIEAAVAAMGSDDATALAALKKAAVYLAAQPDVTFEDRTGMVWDREAIDRAIERLEEDIADAAVNSADGLVGMEWEYTRVTD